MGGLEDRLSQKMRGGKTTVLDDAGDYVGARCGTRGGETSIDEHIGNLFGGTYMLHEDHSSLELSETLRGSRIEAA